MAPTHASLNPRAQVLYRVRHGTARGPVRAVLCENWAVYTYWNTAAARVEVSVLEMFQVRTDVRGYPRICDLDRGGDDVAVIAAAGRRWR